MKHCSYARLRRAVSDREGLSFHIGAERLFQMAMSAFQKFASWIKRSAERRRLADMSDRELKDIGITRYDALMEWKKPFWRE
jgi:uncharacterized protein YjiS (DUF1127 family)